MSKRSPINLVSGTWAGARLGVSPSRVCQYADDGRLPFLEIADGTDRIRRIYRREDVERLAQQRDASAATKGQ